MEKLGSLSIAKAYSQRTNNYLKDKILYLFSCVCLCVCVCVLGLKLKLSEG